MSNVDDEIGQKIGEVRTDALDLSFGEIVNLHGSRELIIQPEYQRLFRWSNSQRSRLIESILLELPIPQIFVIENSDGVLELIDGLQRVSSIIQFINAAAIELEPLRLEGCDIIETLNGKKFDELPLSLRLRLKRSSVRTVVIKRQSKSFLRYEMFKRLNTGGSYLSPQEIRNCSARMLGEAGKTFYEFIQGLSSDPSFSTCIEPLPQADLDQRGNEELVLRFFALKNYESKFAGSVRDWLDTYMEEVLLKKAEFDAHSQERAFHEVFDYLCRVIGQGAFVRYRSGSPIGALAPAYFEAVSIGVLNKLAKATARPDQSVKQAIINTLQSEEFRAITGPGANSKEKLRRRVQAIETAIDAI